MSNFFKIGEVAVKYNISSRTLRYYEEIGILRSIRNEESQYRYYDETAINRLEQILFFRKMQIPIKDIRTVFTANSFQVTIDILSIKLKSLEKEVETNTDLQKVIKAFLSFLHKNNTCPRKLEFNSVFNFKNQLLQIINLDKEHSCNKQN
jgi:DNA-binding transcriptional MerR regulator